MTVYRMPPSEPLVPQPPRRRRAAIAAIAAAVTAHLAVLGAGFYAARTEASTAPVTRDVTVLTGHVAMDDGSGDFRAEGYHTARVRASR